mmetsp:Transcript_88150/g.247986  ORF Transcript_88150/g.247986 Transcript_88150/m.247986 type:complete len:792 (-) Transcript_88150:159-2534(-)
MSMSLSRKKPPPEPDPLLVELGTRTSALEHRLTAELSELKQGVDRAVAAADKRIVAFVSEQFAAAEETRSVALAELRKEVEQQLQVVSKHVDTVKLELNAMGAELAAFVTATGEAQSKHEAALARNREELEASIRKLGAEVPTWVAEAEVRCQQQTASHAKSLAAVRAAVEEATGRLDSRCDELRNDASRIAGEIANGRTASERALKDLAAAFEQQHVELGAEQEAFRETFALDLRRDLQQRLDRGLGEVCDRVEGQVADVEATVESHGAMVRKTAWTVENMYTRSVTWRIPNFKEKARVLFKSEETCLVSPGFSTCSLPEMALELRVATQEAQTPVVPLPGAPRVPLPGLCSVRVWAPPGLQAVFRLSGGDGSAAPPRRYEHVFEAGETPDPQGRVSFLAQNVCQLNHAWKKSGDLATFTFELLEFRLVPVACGAAPPSYVSSLRLSSSCTAVEASVDGTEERSVSPGLQVSASEDAQASEGAEVPPAENEEAESALSTELCTEADVGHGDDSPSADVAADDSLGVEEFVGVGDVRVTRFATSEHVLQERLQKEQQAMRNRSVRHIEWRLEGCARLLDLCAPGQAVDSPLFTAAGLQGVQLHFYPRGADVHASAGGTGEWCALFVSGPARSTVRGVLWVGAHSKPFEHRFQRRGDAGGRSRFCNLETELDCDDAVVLALDLVQVDTELPDSSMSLCLRDARTVTGAVAVSPRRGGGGGAGAGERGGGAVDSRGSTNGMTQPGPVGGAKGVLRMKREDPSRTEEAVRCVSLPTLNTRSHHAPLLRQGQRSR